MKGALTVQHQCRCIMCWVYVTARGAGITALVDGAINSSK